jgi:ATP-dependent DNA helicase RecG
MRDAAHLRALGREQEAFFRIAEAWNSAPFSVTLAAELIRLYGVDNLAKAEEVFAQSKDKVPDIARAYLLNTLANVYIEAGDNNQAQKLLKNYPALCSANDACNAAILARRLGDQKKAHYFFERAGDAVLSDVRALHEFAQTKMKIAQEQWQNAGGHLAGYTKESNIKFLNDARQLLERVIQMDAPPRRHAEASYDLGEVLKRLKAPKSEITAAFQHAVELCPDMPRFKEKLDRLE